MNILSIENLEKTLKDEPLFENVTLGLESGEKVGIVGKNGCGKSTLLNALFPDLSLKTGKISEKSQRGKHTTREVTLFPFGDDKFIADTPGFSRLDLDAVEYFPPEELFFCFPEFEKYFGKCKYKGCTHLREEGCTVISAVECGDIPLSRHESYVTMYEELKNNPRW